MRTKVKLSIRGTGLLLLALSVFITPLVFADLLPGHTVGDDVADTPLEADSLHEQHGGPGGHLPASSQNVQLVGQVTVSGIVPGRISDVGVLGNYAYLGAFNQPCGSGGVYVVDISDPTAPTEVGFIPTASGSFVGEGVQAISLNTPSFKGDILVINNEICAITGSQIGGFSIYDVTNPLAPAPLVIGAGDATPSSSSAVNQIHSAFAWQQVKNAYVVIVDDEEAADVDIFDITNPSAPVPIAEVGLANWPGAQNTQSAGIGTFRASFFHDVVVKKVKGHWMMLLSYWDAGYIILNVDNPAAPVFVDDTDFTDPDPLTGFSPPEGNAHEAEWSHNNKYILAADEDFSPFRTTVGVTSGPFTGASFTASQGNAVPQIVPGSPLSGPTYFVGLPVVPCPQRQYQVLSLSLSAAPSSVPVGSLRKPQTSRRLVMLAASSSTMTRQAVATRSSIWLSQAPFPSCSWRAQARIKSLALRDTTQPTAPADRTRLCLLRAWLARQ